MQGQLMSILNTGDHFVDKSTRIHIQCEQIGDQAVLEIAIYLAERSYKREDERDK
jgi:hypothetical protein